jgi:hypothetical protein
MVFQQSLFLTHTEHAAKQIFWRAIGQNEKLLLFASELVCNTLYN